MLTKNQLEAEIKRLKELAYKDELTGLFNRRGSKKESQKFIKEVVAYKNVKEKRESFIVSNFSIIVFDIDNFKKINDKHGHTAGDRALKNLAKLIQERVRAIDLVARWGGEELVVGLVGADEKDAFNIADDIREKVEKNFNFTVSGGVAAFDHARNFEELFEKADKALYKAKRSGKNKIIKFSDL